MLSNHYDIAVIGGGLAGLTLSIQCARAGYRTVLFEKEQYPFHRVCGEYISLESWSFLERMGVPLQQLNLPIIQRLQVTAPNGQLFETKLPLGGFGISRFTLDYLLENIAKAAGVTVYEQTKVNDVTADGNAFLVHTSTQPVTAKLVAGSFGKRSNLDVKWNRSFIQQKPNKLNNYIGIKYHIRTNHPADVIALHNFENGYCGISQIEEGKYCLCYLTTAGNLQQQGNSIAQLEQQVLAKNPYLHQLLTNAERLYEAPVAISQISFERKTQVEQHLLMLGDAAGMITPLCGNGMSMALHGSKLAFECMDAFLKGSLSRTAMEQRYQQVWQQQFARRLYTGRLIQRFFGRSWLTNLFVQTFKAFPPLAGPLIRQTHGESF